MNEDAFWALIEQLDWDEEGDDDAVVEPVVEALAEMPVDDIFRFEDILAEKLHQLDGEAYAREIGDAAYRGEGASFSVDTFLYARCAAVANGRSFFESVLADPSKMPTDVDFEPLLYVAETAFEQKTGSDDYPHTPSPSFETFSNAAGWAKGGAR